MLDGHQDQCLLCWSLAPNSFPCWLLKCTADVPRFVTFPCCDEHRFVVGCLLLLCFCVRWRVLFMWDYVYVDVRYCLCLCVIAFMYVHVWMFICACVSKSYMWCVLHMWLFYLRGQDMTLLSVVMLFILPLFEGIFLMIKCPVVKLSLVCLRKKTRTAGASIFWRMINLTSTEPF